MCDAKIPSLLMQIVANTTGMLAGLTVIPDKDARDYCVVVVKGTFDVDGSGNMRPAADPVPLVYADQHYGDPETTSVRYECDFALAKPWTDVVVVGKAVAPSGKVVRSLVVELEVEGRSKKALVTGERFWRSGALGLVADGPEPFVEMPLVYERAFGGIDDSRGPGHAVAEPRNLVGVGFHPHRSAREAAGRSLPNIEHPEQPLSGWRGRPEPIGFGCVGRAWAPRCGHAGTYDRQWLDEIYPFLPPDFDHQYFQCAPPDQQFPRFRGGEQITCVHMAAQRVVRYRIPALDVPVAFHFVGGVVQGLCELDTVILEPHLSRAILVWRTRVVLGKKIDLLREIAVGKPPVATGLRRGKPVLPGVAATIRWLRGGDL